MQKEVHSLVKAHTALCCQQFLPREKPQVLHTMGSTGSCFAQHHTSWIEVEVDIFKSIDVGITWSKDTKYGTILSVSFETKMYFDLVLRCVSHFLQIKKNRDNAHWQSHWVLFVSNWQLSLENLYLIYIKITWATANLLSHMHKKFDLSQTMIKGGLSLRNNSYSTWS